MVGEAEPPASFFPDPVKVVGLPVVHAPVQVTAPLFVPHPLLDHFPGPVPHLPLNSAFLQTSAGVRVILLPFRYPCTVPVYSTVRLRLIAFDDRPA